MRGCGHEYPSPSALREGRDANQASGQSVLACRCPSVTSVQFRCKTLLGRRQSCGKHLPFSDHRSGSRRSAVQIIPTNNGTTGCSNCSPSWRAAGTELRAIPTPPKPAVALTKPSTCVWQPSAQMRSLSRRQPRGRASSLAELDYTHS